MSRADLLALTPSSVAALSNVGLVKRAQKDLEQGKGPRLEELADGTVVGVFEDGNTARLLPGKGLKDNPCTCNATAVCRHRVTTVLAYAPWHAARPALESPAAPAPPWSPSDVEDAQLEQRLPSRALERARGQQKRGFLALVQRGTLREDGLGYAEGREPRVSLATCTVRFLVPRDLSHARCDCAAGTWCEHLPLAVWAFRAADVKAPERAEVSVEVARAAVDQTSGGAVLDTAAELVGFVLLEGAQHAGLGLAGRFAVARTGLEEAGMVWPLAALDEVEELLGAYVARSARYAPARLAGVLTELFARMRAARTPGLVPARAVLGMDEASETKLDYARLISLGARLSADERERRVEIVLVDPAAAGLLVVRRAFTYTEEQTPEEGVQLGRRPGVSGTPLNDLARGQVLTSGARRLTNRLVVFSTQGLQRTSVTPQSGDWNQLPAPLYVGDVRALEAGWKDRPPRMLRPRQLAENVHALALGRVVDVTYAPGAQEVHADVEDPQGTAFRLELSHRQVAPGALDALVEALSGGAWGRPRYVSGEVRLTARGLVVEPMAVVCEQAGVIVLDLQPIRSADLSRPPATPPPLPPLRALLAEVEGGLADAVHQGLRHAVPAWTARLKVLAARLGERGLRRLGGDLDALTASLATARASGGAEEEAALVAAWARAAVRTAVAQEQLGE